MHHGKRRFIAGFLVAPLLLYVVFVVSPYLQAFYIAMTDWQGFTANPNFIGLDNFVRLFHDPLFWEALWHNLLLLLLFPAVTVVLGLFFAFMLNVAGGRGAGISGVRGSGFYRVVYFFPYVLSLAIIAILWRFIYHPRIGLLNGFLDAVGLDWLSKAWLGNDATALPAIIFVLIWYAVGFYVVFFTAGMKTIPTDLYEAARIDGAGRAQTFFRITLPLLWDGIQTALVYMCIMALDAFVVVQIMTDGGPDNATNVISLYLYNTAFEYSQFGYASAMGVALFLLTLSLAAIVIRMTRRERIEF